MQAFDRESDDHAKAAWSAKSLKDSFPIVFAAGVFDADEPDRTCEGFDIRKGEPDVRGRYRLVGVEESHDAVVIVFM